MNLSWLIFLILAFSFLSAIEGRSIKHRSRTKPKDACPKGHYYDKESSRCKKIPCGGTVIHTDTKRRCSGKFLGIKVHPKYPQYYYICKPNSVVFVKCPKNQIFNSSISHCVAQNVPDKPAKDSKDCKRSGRFPTTSNCSLFYVCGSDGQKMVKTLMECPKNMVYNPNTQRCSCTHKCTPTEINPDDYFDDYDAETFPPCKRPGRFRSPTDCSLYYTCSAKTNGRFYQTRYRCPFGTLYDNEKEKCYSKHHVKCEYATIEDLIQEYDKTHRYNESDVSEESDEYIDKQIETTLPPLITVQPEQNVDSTTSSPVSQSPIDFKQYEGTEADYLSSSEYYPNLDNDEESGEKTSITDSPIRENASTTDGHTDTANGYKSSITDATFETTTETVEGTQIQTTWKSLSSSVDTHIPSDSSYVTPKPPQIDSSPGVNSHSSTSHLEEIEETTSPPIETTPANDLNRDLFETTTQFSDSELCNRGNSDNIKCVDVVNNSENITIKPTEIDIEKTIATASPTEQSVTTRDGNNTDGTTVLPEIPEGTPGMIYEEKHAVTVEQLIPESLLIQANGTKIEAFTTFSPDDMSSPEQTTSTVDSTVEAATKRIIELPLNVSIDSSEKLVVRIDHVESSTSPSVTAVTMNTDESHQQIYDISTESPLVEWTESSEHKESIPTSDIPEESQTTESTVDSAEADRSGGKYTTPVPFLTKIYESIPKIPINNRTWFETDDVLSDDQEIDSDSPKIVDSITSTMPTEDATSKLDVTSADISFFETTLNPTTTRKEKDIIVVVTNKTEGLTVSVQANVTTTSKNELATESPETNVRTETTNVETEQTTLNPDELLEVKNTTENPKEFVTESVASVDTTVEEKITTANPLSKITEAVNVKSVPIEQQEDTKPVKETSSAPENTTGALQDEEINSSTSQSSIGIVTFTTLFTTSTSLPEVGSKYVESTTIIPEESSSVDSISDLPTTNAPPIDDSTSNTPYTTIEHISKMSRESQKMVEFPSKSNQNIEKSLPTTTEISPNSIEVTTPISPKFEETVTTVKIAIDPAEHEKVTIINGESTTRAEEETIPSAHTTSTTNVEEDYIGTTQPSFQLPSTVLPKPCGQEGDAKISTLNLENKSVETLNVHISKPIKLLLHFRPKFSCDDCQKDGETPVTSKELTKDPKTVYLRF